MTKTTIEEYWRQLALPWELSSYERNIKGLGLVERLATFNRGHINRRKDTVIKILSPFIKGKVVLDIGCAGGIFPLELLARGAAKARGVDISEDVIREAEKRARALHLESRAQFYACSLENYREFGSGNIDLVVGLGILEYLKPELVRDLLTFIKPKGFLFSFDEKVYTMKTGLHYVYRRLKRIPYYKKFTRNELAALLAASGYDSVEVVRQGSNSFVYCLPPNLS